MLTPPSGELGHHGTVRFSSLPNLIVASTLTAGLVLTDLGCGRKGDPIPHARTPPAPCSAHWATHRILEVQLPTQDALGGRLVGVEKVRIYYLPMSAARPSAEDIISRGQVVLERTRPDLPKPGGTLRMDLHQIGRPPGWLVAAAVRVGDVVGGPSEPVIWLDPSI